MNLSVLRKSLVVAFVAAAVSLCCFAMPAQAHAATLQAGSYTELTSAIESAANGDTIQLTGDIDPTQTIAIADKTLTLDLNGHTIANSSDIWNVSGGNYDWSLVSVRGASDVTITGNGALQAKANDCYDVDVCDSAAKLTLKNGNYLGNICAGYVYEGQLYVEGGTFAITQLAGGSHPYDETLNCRNEYYKSGTAAITVTGGSFSNFNPGNCFAEGEGTSFVAVGYEVTQSGSTYTVSARDAKTSGDAEAETDANITIDDATVKSVGEAAASTAAALKESGISGNTVAGVTVADSSDIAAIVSDLGSADSVDVEMVVSAKAGEEDSTIAAAKTENETADYYDVSVEMVVTVNAGTAAEETASAEVTEIPSEIEVAIKVADPSTIAGKYVRVARLHDGNVDYLAATVDDATGTVTFKTNKFSTYAILASAKVTVTFVVDDATYKTVDTGEGQTVANIDDPTKSGYTFSGWYTDEACTAKFDFSTTLKENTTLYAGFTKNADSGDSGSSTTTTTTTTTTTSKAKSATPQTGDNTGLFALGFAVMASVAIAGVGVAARKRS